VNPLGRGEKKEGEEKYREGRRRKEIFASSYIKLCSYAAHRVIAAALRPPSDWWRPPGRPRSTWLTLRVIDEDVQPQNFGVQTAWRKAKDRDTWHQVVSTATSARSSPLRREVTLLLPGVGIIRHERHQIFITGIARISGQNHTSSR